MHTRLSLEVPQTLDDMREIIASIENDGEYPSSELRRRRGVAKDLVEEYIPLYWLARAIPDVRSGYLTPASTSGPDALLAFADDSNWAIQITCAGENKATALQRELLNNREVVFANQVPQRDRATHNITQTGRVLTTKKANADAAVTEILAAIKRKTRKYRSGTDTLLVSIRGSEITMAMGWKQQLLLQISALNDIPYERVYIVGNNTCIRCWPCT